MLQRFLTKYHISTHSGAVVIAFCITTFATSADFRDGLVSIWKAVNARLVPHPFIYLVFFKLGVPLVVTLWGWYRNGQRKTTLDAAISPASGEQIISADSTVAVASTSKATNNQ
jgi:hypothetical protein